MSLRRVFSAVTLTALALSLVAARCTSDDEDEMRLYPTPADSRAPADPSAQSRADTDAEATLLKPDTVRAPSTGEGETVPEIGGEGAPASPKDAKGPEDDLFSDPLDGANAGTPDGATSDVPMLDDSTIQEDASTFEDSGAGGGGEALDGAPSSDDPVDSEPMPDLTE